MRDSAHTRQILLMLLSILLLPSALALAQDDTAETGDGCPGYVIQLRDTLDVIGQNLNVSVVALQQANNLYKPADVRAGDCLIIPEDAPAYGVYPALDEFADDSAGIGGGVEGEPYVIQPRDTLDVIAQAYNISLVSLQYANNLFSVKDVKPGMTIIIPADAPPYGVFPALDQFSDETLGQGGATIEGEPYVIQPRDTLDVIAQAYNISLVSLQYANNLFSVKDVKPGMTIIIPADAPPYGTYPALDQFTDETAGAGGGVEGEVYVVQLRDSLDGIGARFNADVDCLASQNRLSKSDYIYAGLALVIPDDCGPYSGFDVVPAQLPATTDSTEEAVPLGEGDSG
jgi:LysM repeat protein